MQARSLQLFAVLLAALSLTACDQGRKALEKTRVHVVNAAPGFAGPGFQREQPPGVQPVSLAFKAATSYDYDADTYDFFVYQRSLTTQTLPSWHFERTLDGKKNYAFVLAESSGAVTPQVIEYAVKGTGATDTQFGVINTAEKLPAMDVYLEKTGVGIAGAAPKGSLPFLGQVPPTSIEAGAYDVTVTAAGNPANVLFTSTTLNLAAGATNIFVITTENGLGTEQLSMVMVQDNPVVLYSTNATSAVRIINAVDDGQPRDVAIDHQYSPPQFPAVPFGSATAYVTTPISAALPITVTPPGNPGVLELDTNVLTQAGQVNTIVVGGATGALTYQISLDDNRRVYNEAKVQFVNAASQFTTGTDLVLAPPHTADQTTIGAVGTSASLSMSGNLAIVPGTCDLLLRETTTNTVRAGPIPVTFTAGGLYGILVTNGPDTATASVVFFDDQP